MFIEAKDDGGCGDNWTTGAISRAKLQPNHHHQETNILFFTGRMPFLSPNQQGERTSLSFCLSWMPWMRYFLLMSSLKMAQIKKENWHF